MAKICGFRERVHDNTLNSFGIYEHLDNCYDLDDSVSNYLTFTYDSHGERGGYKKSKILPGDGRIEDHWVKENRLSRRRALTLSDLEL